ncbi:hypothetical protein CR513_33461, partial [Mucuna pruriens]
MLRIVIIDFLTTLITFLTMPLKDRKRVDPSQFVDGYIHWFHIISHLHLIPPREEDPSKVLRISKLPQSMLDLKMVIDGTDAWNATREILNISRVGTEVDCTYERRRKTRR